MEGVLLGVQKSASGFKAICFIITYSSMVASYARNLGVPTLVYMNNGLISEATSKSVPADRTGCEGELEG